MSCIHDGHRQRMYDKFLSGAYLEDHEILEMLLFSCIPRANTNEIAHRLIHRFGSLAAVFDADIDQLQEIHGIGKRSALTIRVYAEIIQRYYTSKTSLSGLLVSREDMCSYLVSLFISSPSERTYLLLFGNSGRLISSNLIGTGEYCSDHFSAADITKLASRSSAVYAVLCHNHPSGDTFASSSDIEATHVIGNMLKAFGITLVEHFIVSGTECRSIFRDNTSKLIFTK